MPPIHPPTTFKPASTLALAAMVLLLFSLWSNAFIAVEYLVKPANTSLNWFTLVGARFVPVALICLVWLMLFHRAESWRVVKKHYKRLALAGLFNVAGYNLCLYYSQAQGLAAPVASLMTSLLPLFLMLIAAGFLGERLTVQRIAGFCISLVGVVVIANARDSTGGVSYPLIVAIGAGAPLSWAIYSAISKPVSAQVTPTVWTFLTLITGALPFALVFPWYGGPELLELEAGGWVALGFLGVFSTIVGFVMWTWLLQQLPASSVGFTVFLNPIMTSGYKYLLSLLFASTFAYTVLPQEFFGGGLAMLGVGVAMVRLRQRPPSGSLRLP